MDLRAKLKLEIRLRRAAEPALGFLAVRCCARRGSFRSTPRRMSRRAAAHRRAVGSGASHRPGKTCAAFPEKSAEEIEAILRGVWENLGRVGAEFAHIDRLWDYDPAMPGHGRIMRSDDSEKIALRLRDDGKPALVFAAHLGNWELPALVAHKYGLDTTVLYRRPNLRRCRTRCGALRRAGCMGTLIADHHGSRR